MFNETGLKNVTVNLQSVDNKVVTASSKTLIGLNINDTSINITAALVNVTYTFTMNPHTGDPLIEYTSLLFLCNDVW